MTFHLPPLNFAALRASLALTLILAAFVANALLFGGNWPFATYLTTAALALAAAAACSPRRLPPVLVYGAIAPLVLVLLWAILQSLPTRLLPAPLNLMLPSHPAFALVGNVPWAAAAISPVAGLVQVASSSALLFAAVSLFTLAANPAVANRARLVVAVTCCLAAAYGLLVYINGNHSVLWQPKLNYPADLTATFINRNSYATFTGLGILACLAQFFERLGEISSRLTPRQRLRAFWLLVLRPRWGWLAAVFVLAVALILTHSRAGLAATAVGVAVMLGGLFWARRSTRFIMAGFLLLGVAAGASTLALIGSELGNRFARLPSDNIVRQTIYTLTEDAITQAPYTGHGLGGYAEAFRLIRSPESMRVLTGRVEHAHNTYLELATELGIPALTLLLVAAITVVLVLARGLATRRRAVAWPATGLGALALVGTHGLFDFSLSIPAVTLATTLLAVPALAQSFPQQQEPTAAIRWRNHALWCGLALCIAGIAGWLAWAAWPATRAGATLAQLASAAEPLPPETLAAARHRFAASARRNPNNAAYWRSLAILDMARADRTGSRGFRALLKASAARSLNRALALNPADPASWFRLALVVDEPATRRAALLNSILTGPFEPVLTPARLPLEEEVLRTAPAEDAELIRNHLRQLQQPSTPTPPGRAKPLGVEGGSR